VNPGEISRRLTAGNAWWSDPDQQQTGSVSGEFINGLWDVIAGDAFKRARTTAVQADGLLKRLVLNTGSPTNLSQVADDMSVASHHTVQARIDDLVAAQLAVSPRRRL
jgi:predicted AAA+ superfamily ATPase